jgi:hypothetical protein
LNLPGDFFPASGPTNATSSNPFAGLNLGTMGWALIGIVGVIVLLKAR